MNERRTFLRGTFALACTAVAWCFGQEGGAPVPSDSYSLWPLSSSSSSSSVSAPWAHEGRRIVDASGQITLYDGEGRVVMVWARWREHEHIVTTYYFDTGDSSAG
ncbi:MAG TPA: hypothetical protein VND64_11725 [Pirellulales bacterium]|nr:hypothetical protein [Pirellulales bacterium]